MIFLLLLIDFYFIFIIEDVYEILYFLLKLQLSTLLFHINYARSIMCILD